MNVSFDKSFHKSLLKVKDKTILVKVRSVILLAETATDIWQIPHIKKMEGFKTFYRIRLGDYRIGLELKNSTIWFIIIANRKDIYKNFP